MNLLVIFTDQQRKDALGCVNPLFQTPHLDQLADEGVLFTNAYSNNPLCGPFRGCLMTGMLTSHNGLTANNMPLPDQIPPIARLLRDRGWETAYVGKWHLGGRGCQPIPEEIRGGFQHFKAYQMYNGYDPEPPYANRVGFFDEQNEEHIYHEHRTKVTTRLAVETLEELALKKKPFCMMVGYQAPHYPEQPSPEFEALYAHTQFPISEEAAAVEPYTPTFNPPSPADRAQDPDYQRYGGDMQTYKRLYAAMVSQVDHGVGLIMEALKSLKLYDDTLIVYTSDHGDMQGSHGLVNKDVPFEFSAGIPFIVRCPGGKRRCRSDMVVSGIDIFATAMDLANVPDHRDGHSFLPYMQNKNDQATNDAIVSESIHGGKDWQMIRTAQHKLVVSYPEHQPLMLFDMNRDPDERCNLIENGGYDPQFVAALIARLP